MLYPINIVITVDSIGALSSGSLEDNLFMMDTSLESKNQGTDMLATHCYQGQVINWIVYAVDVQTPVVIRDITLINIENDNSSDVSIPLNYLTQYYWSGYIPFNLKGTYRYKLSVQIENGKYGDLYIDTPSLEVKSLYGEEL